jgi:hypothetical protein
MKLITTLSLLFIGVMSFAQSVSLTIFNNNGQQFFVIMNGIRQNSLPQTNVKVGGMTTGSYEVKLIFADGKTGDINKKIYIDATGDYLVRVVFKGKKRKLQYFGMTENGQLPAGGTTIQYRPNDQSTYSDQSAVVNTNTQYGNQQNGTVSQSGQTTQNTGTGMQQNGTVVTNTGNGNGQVGMNTNVVVTDPNATNGQMGMGTNVVVTDPNTSNGQVGMNTNVNISDPNATQGGTINTGTTITDPNMNGGQMGMNVSISVSDPSMGGTGSQSGTISTGTTITDPEMNNGQIGINMNVSGMGTGQGTSTSTSTTTSTSSSTTTQNGQVVNDSYNYQQTTSVTQNGQTTTTTQSSQYGNNGQNGNIQQNVVVNGGSGTVVTQPNGTNHTCTNILVDGEGFVGRLNAESFDADKREMIETDLKNYCLSANQAYAIVKALTFDADRIDMCMFLYDRMTDKANAGKLIELLTFDADKDEFRQYMKTH